MAFVAALRRAGVPVGTSETLDAVRAVAAVDLLRRDSVRAAMAATTVKRPTHRATFDALFDLYFPAALGPGSVADDLTPVGLDPADPAAMRELLRALVLAGDDAALAGFARLAVGALGGAEAGSFSSLRVLRALSPDTLLAGLLAAALGDDRGGFAEQVARRTFAERLQRFTTLVEAEVRRRLAEQRGPDRAARSGVPRLPEQVDFVRATAADLADLRRTVLPLARRLATRLATRRRRGDHGPLDFRRTVRASLATGGVPADPRFRRRRPHRPELVLLCDVSGSVSAFARFTLLLAYALREQFARVRVFAFVDTLDEVTDCFRSGDVAEALRRQGSEARVVRFDGHSDYGHSFEVFAERYADAVTPRTSLLVLGDARTNHRDPGLGALAASVRRARHAYWLNPEPREHWNSGDSEASAYASVVEMVEVRNAEQLSQFVRRLLPAG